ncbi:MAG TPA: sigma-54 dependent transcriptional regulator [Bryobacteraceae bacterium]|nr:sigma-54 dependent transcriptional regulator [Bryobacteraceae bacterium]
MHALSRPELIVIDDDPAVIDLIRLATAVRKIEIAGFTSPNVGLEYIAEHQPELVLLDVNMPELNGMEALERITAVAPGAEVILITADYSTETAIRAIKLGASDYWIKPLNLDRLRDWVDTWLSDRHGTQKRLAPDAVLARAYDSCGIVGRSPSLLDMFTKMRRIAPHFQTVIICGDTGTGKELVANTLHQLSPRADQPLVICNCAALVDTLVESELFGYVKGAFTGAGDDRVGLIEAADKGTLLLDEVGEVPPVTQAKLLRVLQNREVRRVGEARSRNIDVHFIATTNRNLRKMVETGSFREDLYYRLAMVELRVPSLAERRDDLPLLLRHFLDKSSREYGKPGLCFTRRAELLLSRYSWPGNIRELQLMIEGCVMVSEDKPIDVGDLPAWVLQPDLPQKNPENLVPIDEITLRHARYVLSKVGGNHSRAAEVLGIARTTLYRLLREHPLAEERAVRF